MSANLQLRRLRILGAHLQQLGHASRDGDHLLSALDTTAVSDSSRSETATEKDPVHSHIDDHLEAHVARLRAQLKRSSMPSDDFITAVRSSLFAAGVTPLVASTVLHTMFKNPRHSWVKTLGNLSGLLALELIAGQTVMGAKVPVVENFFGFDKTMVLHRQLSYFVLGLASLHAVQKAWGKKWTYLFTVFGNRNVLYGRLAFYGMLLAFLLAYFKHSFAERGYVPRWLWKSVHYLLYPIYGLILYHSYKLGIRREKSYPIWWIAFIVAALATLYRCWNLLVVRASGAQTFHVSGVVQRTFDVTTVTLAPPSSSLVPHSFSKRHAGQFAILRRKLPNGLWSDPHPFTLSGSPFQRELEFTIKAMPHGTFSTTVANWKQGDPILVEGPFGAFTPNLASDQPLVLIAGGVGITPFLSILRAAYERQVATGHCPKITLVWGIKDRKDLMLMDEFESYLRHLYDFTFVLALSSKDAVEELLSSPEAQTLSDRIKSNLVQGFVTDKVLEKHVGSSYRASYYLCGPPSMIKLVSAALGRAFHVPLAQIHYEYFSW